MPLSSVAYKKKSELTVVQCTKYVEFRRLTYLLLMILISRANNSMLEHAHRQGHRRNIIHDA